MTCPNCKKSRDPAAEECQWCGVVFAKWKQRPQRRVVPSHAVEPTTEAAEAKGSWGKAAVIGVGFGMALTFFWVFTKEKTPETPAPEAATSRPSQGSPAPVKKVRDPLKILDPILADMNSRSASYGITFTRHDVRFAYDEGRRFLHPARLPQLEDELGLPARTVEEFSEADKDAMRAQEGNASYKCRIRDQWVYSGTLPDNADEISECWRRLRGNTVSGPVMFINNPLNTWELYQWRPDFGSWGRFSEEDSLRGWEYLIDKELGDETQARDEEKAEEAIERALNQESESVKQNHLKMALVAAFRSRLIQTAALARLEELRR